MSVRVGRAAQEELKLKDAYDALGQTVFMAAPVWWELLLLAPV